MKSVGLKTLLAVILTAGLCLAGCDEGAQEPARVYTEQTAHAIVDAGQHIGFCMILAAVVRGILNK